MASLWCNSREKRMRAQKRERQSKNARERERHWTHVRLDTMGLSSLAAVEAGEEEEVFAED